MYMGRDQVWGGDRAPREPGCGQGLRDGEKQIWGKAVMGRSGEGAGYLQTSQTRWGSPHPKSLVSGTPKELKAFPLTSGSCSKPPGQA